MNKRSNFPPVFWVANSVEVLERFAYYGIFFTFYAYMNDMGFDRAELGNVQKWFLFISYFIPVFSGTFADKFGFKKILIISYLAYLPSILLLMVTDTLSGIKLTMISIGFAAGIFKPLVSGTIRLTTDSTNKTLGFGIFYAMVNIGGSFGPIIAAKLRAISWNTAFMAAAISIGLMLIITIFFYKEPEREKSDVNIGKKLYGILETLLDIRFSVFLVLLGFFFWLPFWAFFNICPAYIDTHIDTVKLYNSFSGIFGEWFTKFLSREENGIWRINGESIAHTGWIIMILQVFVSRLFEKRKAIPSFLIGIFVAAIGFTLIGYSVHLAPAIVILGVAVFAVGEMISSPRIQEYITWIAPKEKAGQYMGSNFLAICIGAFCSGYYTKFFGKFEEAGNPEYIWYVMAANCILGIIAFLLFVKFAGEFKEKHE